MAALRYPRRGPSFPAANTAILGRRHAMTPIRRALGIGPDTIRAVVGHLGADVSI